MSFQFRETSDPRDFTEIQNIVAAARSNGDAWSLSWLPHLLVDELTSARVYVAVESAGASVVGFILLRPPGAAWEITLTAVSAVTRKSGVFRGLLGFVSQEIRRDASQPNAGTAIDLEVRADNQAAISAYESSGFVAVGRRRGYYSDGVDAILYKRE